jgi:hypothetical protein
LNHDITAVTEVVNEQTSNTQHNEQTQNSPQILLSKMSPRSPPPQNSTRFLDTTSKNSNSKLSPKQNLSDFLNINSF